jgi:hypothetical protein
MIATLGGVAGIDDDDEASFRFSLVAVIAILPSFTRLNTCLTVSADAGAEKEGDETGTQGGETEAVGNTGK